jgi:hypothetical protein
MKAQSAFSHSKSERKLIIDTLFIEEVEHEWAASEKTEVYG